MAEIYPTPQESTPIYLSSERDVLALALHLLGYWPEKSIMLLALSNEGAGPLMRLDMPDLSEVAPEDFLTYIFEAFPVYTPAGKRITKVFFLLFSDGVASGTVDTALENTFLETAQRYAELAPVEASRQGINIIDVLAVGQEAYWAVNPEEGELSPAGFLEEVATSPLYIELVARGSYVANDSRQAQELKEVKRYPAMGTADPESQERWQLQTEASSTIYLKDKQEKRPQEAHQIAGELELWEQAIGRVTCLLDGWKPGKEAADGQTLADAIRGKVLPDAAGFLLASLDSFATLQLVIFQACRSLKDSLAALRSLEESSQGMGINSQAKGERVLPLPSTLHRYRLNHLSHCQLVDQDQVGPADHSMKALAQTLFGVDTAPPSWKRLEALEYLAILLEGSATGKAEAALVAAQAWLAWMRGNSTRAFHLLENMDGSYRDGVSLPLYNLLGRSAFPAWLTLPGGAPDAYVTKNSS